jgi:proline dehydrogenase
MEDAQTTSKTIAMFKWALAQGFEDVGIVIQSYLFRSEKDIEELSRRGGRVRLCKGAYKEPPAIAFPKKADVDKNYDLLARRLLVSSKDAGFPVSKNNGKIPPIPAIATHDINRIEFVKSEMEITGTPKGAVEFQMLYGIRRDLQEQLVKEGYQVRVYVPFGTHWFPYFMRRLAERPANVWFFVSNFFKK